MALPPGPELPSVAQAGWYVLRPFDLVDTCVRRYGDLFTLRLFRFGTLVCASHPDTVKLIFTGDPEALPVGAANEPFRPLIGDRSILLLDGPEHLRLRRLFYPLFHGEALDAYTALIAGVTRRAFHVDPRARPTPVQIHDRMQEITLDVIVRAVFGVEAEDDRLALHDALATLVNRNASPAAGLLMVPALQRDLGPLTPWAAFRRSIDRIDALVYRQIARVRRSPGRGGDDILSRMVAAAAAEGGSFSDAELRDHLVTLLMAGHETTAATLTWAFALILDAPAVAARIGDELRRVTGGGEVRAEHLDRLEYLDAVVREVMRLRPVVPILGLGRMVKRPMVVQGHTLPAGVKLVPLAYATHRRPDLYPEPERFLPERFVGKKIDPYTWFPFGGGVRRCLGLGFALHEIKTVLAVAFSSARLRLHGRPGLTPTLQGITIGPEGGAQMMVEASAGGRGLGPLAAPS